MANTELITVAKKMLFTNWLIWVVLSCLETEVINFTENIEPLVCVQLGAGERQSQAAPKALPSSSFLIVSPPL